MKLLFGLLDKAVAVKNTVSDVFNAFSFVLQLRDRIDDDLDGDGKSEAQNIFEKLEEIESEAIAYAKNLWGDIMDIVTRANKLRAHVMEKK